MTKQARKPRQGSTFVYQLVERMSSEEKRFFKIFAQKYDKGKDNLCLSLFNAINTEQRKGNTIDDELIRQRVKGLKLEGYFVSAKNKLKNMLCDALYEMHGKHNEDFAIIKEMGIAGILHEKGFSQERNKQLQQAMDAAYQKEYYTLWLEGFRHRLNYNTDVNDYQTLHQWNKERDEVLDILNDYTKQILHNRLCFTAYISPSNKIDSKTQKLFQEAALAENVRNTKSAYAKYLALNGQIFYLYKRRELDRVNALALQQKEILQSTLAYTPRYVGEFFVAYQNYLNSISPATDAPLIIEGSRDMEQLAKQYLIKGRNKQLGNVVICSACMMRLNVYIEHNNKKELLNETGLGIKIYKQASGHVGLAHQVALLALVKDAYFVLGKYSDALKWIKEIKAIAPAGLLNNYKLCNLITELLILIDNKASVRALRNSEENIRLAITRFNYSDAHQAALQNLLKHIGNVPTARNKTEATTYLQNLLHFIDTTRQHNDASLNNIIAECNVRLWTTRKL